MDERLLRVEREFIARSANVALFEKVAFGIDRDQDPEPDVELATVD